MSSVITGANNNANYQFGYADVHPNVSLGGTVSYNPYTLNDSSTAWATISSGTSGGDPIDISWAVTSTGAPAKLDAVRYIRVYTSAAQMNGINGEISTEVCGISVCTGTATDTTGSISVTVNNSPVTVVNGDITTVNNLGSSAVPVTVTGTGNILINGEYASTKNITPGRDGKLVQIIVQNGDAAPYITWLNLIK